MQLAGFVKTRPWSPKHRLPADVQAILPTRAPPDKELFPQVRQSALTDPRTFSRARSLARPAIRPRASQPASQPG
jgi:hypothetical protein